MIQRVVAVKLKASYRDASTLQSIAAETVRVLGQAVGVLDVRVGLPGDLRTGREWDLCIFVQLASMEDVETYRVDPVHRAYADTFLAPLRTQIRVWNFELAEATE
ncbi:MAG: Dabb family protein [Planctomycetota bacterium]